MFLAAQSMAVGTVMVRWVSKYSDPVMATGWVSFTILYGSTFDFLIVISQIGISIYVIKPLLTYYVID